MTSLLNLFGVQTAAHQGLVQDPSSQLHIRMERLRNQEQPFHVNHQNNNFSLLNFQGGLYEYASHSLILYFEFVVRAMPSSKNIKICRDQENICAIQAFSEMQTNRCVLESL